MPVAVPEAIQRRIKEEFELGYCNDAILLGRYNVSRRTLQRMRRLWEDTGEVSLPVGIRGRHPKLTEDHIEELLLYLDQRPTAYLDEMAYFLFDEYDLEVDTSTIWRALKKAGWSRKKNRKIAAQRNEILRDHWRTEKLPQWTAEMLVFMDESAACERTADRKYGWAPLGVTPELWQMLKRSKRWSILPAFTIHGYLDWVIYQGSITAEIFNDFVKDHVLPHCGRYSEKEPRSVLILDNAKIHHSEALREMCEEADVLLEFLPPYSPDLNPIETSFALLKAYIRRHSQLAVEFALDGDFEIFLDTAVRSFGGEGDPGNLFRLAGVQCDAGEEIPHELEGFYNDADSDLEE